jgi:hypothetical protein
MYTGRDVVNKSLTLRYANKLAPYNNNNDDDDGARGGGKKNTRHRVPQK